MLLGLCACVNVVWTLRQGYWWGHCSTTTIGTLFWDWEHHSRYTDIVALLQLGLCSGTGSSIVDTLTLQHYYNWDSVLGAS